MPSRDDWITLVTLLDRKTQEGTLRWKPISGSAVRDAINAFQAVVDGAQYRIYEVEQQSNPFERAVADALSPMRTGILEALRPRNPIADALAGTSGQDKLSRVSRAGVTLVVQQTPDSPEITAPQVPGLESLLKSVVRQVIDIDALIRKLSSVSPTSSEG